MEAQRKGLNSGKKLRVGKIRGGFIRGSDHLNEFWMIKKETGIGQGGTSKVGQRHEGSKELTECREPQQLKMLGYQKSQQEAGLARGCTGANQVLPGSRRKLWEMEMSLWRRQQSLEAGKTAALVDRLRKSFQAGDKVWRWESGREIFGEASDLAGGRNVRRTVTAEHRQSPCTESGPMEEWLELF